MRMASDMRKEMWQIALPITAQSLFQASMSVIDQIMTGQLGAVSVAGIGIAGKFSSLYSVIAAAVAAAAGILIAQFIGNRDWDGVSRYFWLSLCTVAGLAVLFTVIGAGGAETVMKIYSEDPDTVRAAAVYLRILSIGFVPMALTTILTTVHRGVGYAKVPLYAGIVSVCVNTGLNYLLIFGKCGFPEMGIAGAAWATTIARLTELLLVIGFTGYLQQGGNIKIKIISPAQMESRDFRLYLTVLGPIFLCEALWSLGENVYAVIYGRMGTDPCAAMTLTGPVQNLMIGAMTGMASAAGIMIGKKLGKGKEEEAYREGKLFMWYGFLGTAVFSVILLLLRGSYVRLFDVEPAVKEMTVQILTAYAIVVIVKVENMILGGGIIRSGGKTKLILIIDMIGTWCVGIPLGLLSAFVWNLPIAWTYLILSQEECVRFIISLVVFRKKIWMQNLTKGNI